MMWWDLPRYFFVLPFIFVLGTCVGSFLNVCIHRFPAHVRLRDQLRALNRHRSGCPKCLSSILWRDNIPLLGWLLLRGRCRTCSQRISVRYPFVELLTGLLFVAVYQSEMPSTFWSSPQEFGLYSVNGPHHITGLWSVPVWLHVRYLLHMGMLCSLIVATFIDLELRIIPDGCTTPMMLVALVVMAAFGQAWIIPLWIQDDSIVQILRPLLPEAVQPLMFSWNCQPFAAQHPYWHGFLVSLAGLIVGGGVVWLVRVIGVIVLRQEAMGFGDVTLMAMVGSVIGWQLATAVFVIAPILALTAALSSWLLKREHEFPYGPWLALATAVVLLAWPVTWPRIERVFHMGALLPLLSAVMVVSLAASLQLVRVIKTAMGSTGPDHPLRLRDLEEFRAVRRWLGWPVDDWMPEDGGWTSADHLSYYNSERTDDQILQWPRDTWPGHRAGQGLSAYQRWRFGRRN